MTPKPESDRTRTNRREFLGASAAAGLALGLPTASARAIGANERVRIGTIGSGGRTRELMRAAVLVPNQEFVHLCDVWDQAIGEASKNAPDAKKSKDFRAVLDDKDVDAVLIATPDHWHVPILEEALAAGKHVYAEKPLTHSMEEGDRALAAAKAHPDLVIQVGQQQRSMAHLRRGYEELVEPGKLGPVFHARIWWGYWAYPKRPGNYEGVTDEGLDWKAWLGPAPERPFDPERFRSWRKFWEYGGGHTGDLATHLIDVVHWYLGLDHPESAVAAGGTFFSEDGRPTPDTIHALWTYPQEVVVTWEGNQSNGDGGAGIELNGANGTLYADRQMVEFRPKVGAATTIRDGILPRGWYVTRPDQDAEHLKDWIAAIREGGPVRAPIEVGILAAGASHLANRAYREGGRAEWPKGG